MREQPIIHTSHLRIKNNLVVDEGATDNTGKSNEFNKIDTKFQRFDPVGTTLTYTQTDHYSNHPNDSSPAHIQQRSSQTVHSLGNPHPVVIIKCVRN